MFAIESLRQEFVTSNICTYDKSGLTLPNTNLSFLGITLISS